MTHLKIFLVIVVFALVLAGIVWLLRSKEGFNINQEPVRGGPYAMLSTRCGNMSEPECQNWYSSGMGGAYGLNPEHDNNVTIVDFVDKFEKDTVFGQYEANLSPMLMHQQTGYEIPARQYCEILYQGHNQLFNNLYNGLGDCEVKAADEAKKSGVIKVKTI